MGNKGKKKKDAKYSKKRTNNMPSKSKDFNLNKVKPCEEKYTSYRASYTHEDGFEIVDNWISSNNNRYRGQFAQVIMSYNRKTNTFLTNKYTYGESLDYDEDFISRSVKASIEKAFKIRIDIDLTCIQDRLKNNKESLIIGYEICTFGPSKYIASLERDCGAYDEIKFSESSCDSIKESLTKLNDKFIEKENNYLEETFSLEE